MLLDVLWSVPSVSEVSVAAELYCSPTDGLRGWLAAAVRYVTSVLAAGVWRAPLTRPQRSPRGCAVFTGRPDGTRGITPEQCQ